MQNMILSPVAIENLAAGIAKEVTKQLILDGYVSNKPITNNDELLTRKEAAGLLSISLVTLGNWSKKGTIKGHRIGRRVRYKKNELIASLKQMKTSKN